MHWLKALSSVSSSTTVLEFVLNSKTTVLVLQHWFITLHIGNRLYFLSSPDLFKINLFKKYFKNIIIVNQIVSRSGSKFFAKVISRRQ